MPSPDALKPNTIRASPISKRGMMPKSCGITERLERATRRATVTPFKGDQQLDWVTQKYRYYYNNNEQLIWRTDDVSLIGVRDGKRLNTYADATGEGSFVTPDLKPAATELCGASSFILCVQQ